MPPKILHYYRKITDVPSALISLLLEELMNHGYCSDAPHDFVHMDVEYCYNVLPSEVLSDGTTTLTMEQTKRLEWLLAETFEPNHLQLEQSFFDAMAAEEEKEEEKKETIKVIIEYGPRMTFTSAFSSNATSICQACDIPIARLELSKRYRLHINSSISSSNSMLDDTTQCLKAPVLRIIHSILHDRMTQEVYETPLVSFDSGIDMAQPTKTIPIMEEGRAALERINQEMGLGFDDFDLNYYTELFQVRCILTQFVRQRSNPSMDTNHSLIYHFPLLCFEISISMYDT